MPSSAYATLGAGHGNTCGKATTKKLAKRVVAKSEDVRRLRGWRCGGGLILAGKERMVLGLVRRVQLGQLVSLKWNLPESTPVNERKALVDLEGEEVKWDDTF